MPIIIGRPNGTGGGGGGSSPEQEARLEALEQSNTQKGIRLDAVESKNTTQDTKLTQHDARIEANASVISSQAERLSAVENSIVDYSPEIQGLVAKNTDQDSEISLVKSKNTEQDDRLTTAEGSISSQASTISTMQTTLANKADLVSGKIPLAQLPDLPVGRKVSVANQAERLSLSVHPDLTIAYESDTADAWALDANEDPSVAANWDKLGNAQATGVQSFNGRTGNVSPQNGDYTTSQITTTTDRSFISDADRIRWDNKSTPTSVEAAVSTLRSEVQAGYVRTNTLGANNGVATLGSDGKVVSSQLPPLGLTATQARRIDEIESTARFADLKGDSAAENILALDNRLTQVDTDSKSRDAAQVSRIAALEVKPASVPLSQKGAASGVVPLDSASKIDTAFIKTNVVGGVPLLDSNNRVSSTYLYRNAANGIAGLDANSRVSSANLPTYLPQNARIWRDQTANRTKGLWYSNTSGNEMTLHLTSDNVNNGGYFNIQLRANSSSPTLDFICNSSSQAADGVTTRAFGTLTVPAGWDYAVNTTNLGTRNILKWYELS